MSSKSSAGRPRLHDTGAILDAARGLALEQGARAVTAEAISGRSGASIGSLYNRFGSRDAILAATWERALARFQGPFVEALEGGDVRSSALEAAAWIIRFARAEPEDARLLAAFRPEDVLKDQDSAAARRLGSGNAEILEAMRRLAGRVEGTPRRRALELLTLAVIDLPGGAIRRRLIAGERIPVSLEADVGTAAGALLDQLADR